MIYRPPYPKLVVHHEGCVRTESRGLGGGTLQAVNRSPFDSRQQGVQNALEMGFHYLWLAAACFECEKGPIPALSGVY